MNTIANNVPPVVLPRGEEVDPTIIYGNMIPSLSVTMATDSSMFLVFKVHGITNLCEVNVYESQLISVVLENYGKGLRAVKASFLLLLLFYQDNNTLLLGSRPIHDI